MNSIERATRIIASVGISFPHGGCDRFVNVLARELEQARTVALDEAAQVAESLEEVTNGISTAIRALKDK